MKKINPEKITLEETIPKEIELNFEAGIWVIRIDKIMFGQYTNRKLAESIFNELLEEQKKVE